MAKFSFTQWKEQYFTNLSSFRVLGFRVHRVLPSPIHISAFSLLFRRKLVACRSSASTIRTLSPYPQHHDETLNTLQDTLIHVYFKYQISVYASLRVTDLPVLFPSWP